MIRHSGYSSSTLTSTLRVLPVLCAFALLSCIAVLAWPVDVLKIHQFLPNEENKLLFSCPAPLGFAYHTRMLHSVQLSPVLDIQRVQEGRIWPWQEHIMSHNAGLPSLTPGRGRFISDPPWMIMEGGGAFWQEIYYRVGTESLGKNEFRVPPDDWVELWRPFPGKRLIFSVDRMPLFMACEAQGFGVSARQDSPGTKD